MEQQESGRDHEHIAGKLPTAAGPVVSHEADKADQGHQESRHGYNHSRNQPPPRRRERLPNFLSGVVAASTLIYAIVSSCQLLTMRHSLDELQKSNASSQRIADANTKLVDATVKGIAESKRQADAATRATYLAERSFDQNGRSSQENLNLARRTLLESKKSLEIVQRARLGVDHIEAYALNEGVEGVAELFVRNSGPMPATNMVVERIWSSFMLVEHVPPLPADKPAPRSRSVVLSGASMVLEVPIPALDAQRLAAIREKRALLYIEGELTYDDGFGVKRSLGFCAIHQAKRWEGCSFHNWAD